MHCPNSAHHLLGIDTHRGQHRAGRIPAVSLTDRLIRFNLREVQKALRSTLAARDGEASQEQEPSPQLSFDDLFPKFDGVD